jgi:hypothetical protein
MILRAATDLRYLLCAIDVLPAVNGRDSYGAMHELPLA